MILMYTDFGLEGPYLGQMQAVLSDLAPGVPVINLMADAPAYAPRAAGRLLAALATDMPPGAIVLGVVDPGVGSAERDPLVVRADGRWYVGPGNGLFDGVAAKATEAEGWRITWRPERLSMSFHGRDLFAPVAAMLGCGRMPAVEPLEWRPDPAAVSDLCEIIYIDHFGNAMTGIDAGNATGAVVVGGTALRQAATFSDVPPGELFWYENSNGLVEIAANRASAAALLGLKLGAPVVLG